MLDNTRFSKDRATVKENIKIIAVTSANAAKLIMYANGQVVKSWTEGYKDQDGKRTWTITHAFVGAGESHLEFRAADQKGATTEAMAATITITKAPVLSSVKFNKVNAAVKENVTIVAVTNTLATKLVMYSGGKAVKSWTEGYTDKDGKRV